MLLSELVLSHHFLPDEHLKIKTSQNRFAESEVQSVPDWE